MSDTPSPSWYDELKALFTQREKPILVGPFRQELGFEVLYWIPFLHWAFKEFTVDPSRVRVASRSGSGVYYGIKQGFELCRLRSLKELRIANAYDFYRTQSLKHQELTAFDRELIAGIEYEERQRFAVVHPALMFQAFNAAWHGQAPITELSSRLLYTRFKAPPLPPTLTLPDSFTVLGFYARATLPATGPVAYWVRRTVRDLAERGAVIALEPAYHGDDHCRFRLPDHKNLWRIGKEIEADDGLAIQGAIIARATRFVGTYGGLQQLALFLGVPSVGYYFTLKGTLPVHLDMSLRLSREMHVPFHVLQAEADVPFLKEVL